MSKNRRELSSKIETEILFQTNHTCCICRDSAHDVQIHHIDGNPSNNTLNNLAVVCLNCHSRVTGKRGLGQAYKPEEIRKYKQDWEKQVKESREKSDKSAIDNLQLKKYSFKIIPDIRRIDTGIDVKMGEYITGEIDLSNPFHIDTTQDFPWMPDFVNRYKNQGKWIGKVKYISPSGMKTYDENGKLIHFEYPDVVFNTWGAIYLQVDDVKYRIECLSIKNSLINEPPDTKMKPLLMEKPGRLYIYVNPHPYAEGTKGEIIVKIRKH